MAYQKLTVGADWLASAQYVAAGQTEVRLVNSHGDNLFWITTSSATAPTLPEVQASPIAGGQVADVTLEDGEQLWLAAPWLDGQTVDVTLMF